MRALIDLALNSGSEPVSLKDIAKRQDVSLNYLEQIFALLKKGKIVKSIRGSQGGYVFADDIDNITIGEVLIVLEGSFAPVGCVTKEHPVKCEKYDRCITKFLWKKMRNNLYVMLNGITIKDLINDYFENNKCSNLEREL
mgnify:CR=1 FL=1